MTRLNDFALFILAYMEDHELTRQALADLIGVNRMTLRYWLKGDANPAYDTIIQICRALDVGVEDLFPDDCVKGGRI